MTTTGAIYAGELRNVRSAGHGSVAGLPARGTAFLLDVLLVLVPATSGHGRLALVALVAYVAGHWLFGMTPGKLVTGLRTYAVDEGLVLYDQRGLTLVTAVMRTTMVAFWPFFLFALMTLDDDRRTIYDRVARTVVLRR